MSQNNSLTIVPADQLRWKCPLDELDFESTADIPHSKEIHGQQTALDALQFGIECSAPGQNVYVRGKSGTGRKSMIRQLLEDYKPAKVHKYDRCYVHNFARPERPRLISLDAGTACKFRNQIKEFATYIKEDLNEALNADYLLARRTAIQTAAQENIQQLKAPLEEDLKKSAMALVSIQTGQMMQTTIFPIVDKQPIAPEQFNQLVLQGKVSEKRKKDFDEHYPEFQKRLQVISRDINAILEKATRQAIEVNENETRDLLAQIGDKIKNNFPFESVNTFVNEMIDNVISTFISGGNKEQDPVSLYDVNVLVEHNNDNSVPVIIENTPNLVNLLGTVEPEWGSQGPTHIDFGGIHAGSLLRADGGYLILEAKDLLTEPGAWRALIRTLRTGYLEIVPSEIGWLGSVTVLKPEPIKIKVRVILMGDHMIYYQLDMLDPDFSELFKVLADFDDDIARNNKSISQYISVISRIIQDENLPHFSTQAVAAIIEHGARIVSRARKLTAKFGRIADIIREAAFLCGKSDHALVQREHVIQAIQRTKQRASLPSRSFQELVNNGTILIQTRGEVIGQINGLAVIHSGPITYGFPARITSTIAPGRGGLINIEGSANLSGSIHTKGFNILGGLLRYLLKPTHPMSFSASIAFEQSYGGIDGDSASGAETVCLISALTNVPIKQSVAMTGAIDQHGHIEAIGGVNEKIEGFFDACNYAGLTGDQAVIIPHANAADLMLRADVVDACKRGQFSVHAVSTIYQALEIATGVVAGEMVDGVYPQDTLMDIAQRKLFDYWDQTLSHPDKLDDEVSAIEDNSEDV